MYRTLSGYMISISDIFVCRIDCNADVWQKGYTVLK